MQVISSIATYELLLVQQGDSEGFRSEDSQNTSNITMI